MSTVPVGYEAFHSFRRKGVTLLCFLLASTMAMSVTVYVDSYSVHEWEKIIDVGPVAVVVSGVTNIENKIDDVLAINGITRAAVLKIGWGVVESRVWDEYSGQWYYDGWGVIAHAPDEDYLTTFPDIYEFEEGRAPTDDDEIALNANLVTYFGLSIGSHVNFSSGWREEYRVDLTLVGIFTTGASSSGNYYYYSSAEALVVESLLRDEQETIIHADVDRVPITPFDARGSLSYLYTIDDAIRRLDPDYPTYKQWSDYSVDNYLEYGVSYFISWQYNLRINQLSRSGAAILILTLVLFLAIRHNINERRYESSMLMSRGASQSDIDKITTREVIILSIVGCLMGIAIGSVISRFAIASTGFFQFDPTLLITEPFLITLDSLILSAVVGFAIPVLTLFAYRAIYSTKKRVEDEQGRLAKVAKGLVIIRWDVLVIILSLLLIYALYSAGQSLQSIPLLSLILSIVPLATFLGVASLTIKMLRRGGTTISKKLERFVGKVPSTVGIRRVGKSASSAGPAAMVLVLAISIAWTNAVIDSTLPKTKLSQSRFGIGADVAFHLDEFNYDIWDEFIDNVTAHELTEKGTLASIKTLYMTAGWGPGVQFVAIDPKEYKEIGYDYNGIILENSSMNTLLDELYSNPTGAVITQDIADDYELAVGDSLRTFSGEGETTDVYVFTILGIVEAIPDALLPSSGSNIYYDYPVAVPYQYYYWWYEVGKNRVWINRDFALSQLNLDLVNNTRNVYYVKTTEGANGTALVEDILNQGGNDAITYSGWASVTYEVENFVNDATYRMDRAVDTVLTIVTVGIIFGGFAIYAAEGIRARRREIALLRSMGAKVDLVIKAQAAEMLVLTSVSILLLLGYSPLYLAISLLNSAWTSMGSSYIYPVVVFPVFPWLTMILVLLFFIVSVVIFIMVVAALSSKINLASALNAAWAEAGPYGGEV
jgi:ABC-type lipoprotein release transport system permease subunit